MAVRTGPREIPYFIWGTNPPSGTPGDFPTAVRFGGGFQQGGTAINDGTWHMVTFVDDAGDKDIYVDGNLTSATQTGFNGQDVGDTVRIGFNVDSLSNLDGNINMLGDLDELQFYNSSLTQQQVQELFTANQVTTGTTRGWPIAARNDTPSTLPQAARPLTSMATARLSVRSPV